MPSGAAESASGLDGRPELGSGHLPQSPRSTLFSQFSVGGKPQFSAAQGSPIQGSGEIRIFGSCADSREPAGGVGQPWNEVSREVVWLRSGRRPWPGPFNLCLPSPPPLPGPGRSASPAVLCTRRVRCWSAERSSATTSRGSWLLQPGFPGRRAAHDDACPVVRVRARVLRVGRAKGGSEPRRSAFAKHRSPTSCLAQEPTGICPRVDRKLILIKSS